MRKVKKSKSRSNTIAVGPGIPSVRCEEMTEMRAHVAVTEKLLRQPFYYRRWYCCLNPKCKTTLIMLDEDRVIPRPSNRVLWTDSGEFPQ